MRFEELNTIELDKDLTEEQQRAWNAIYASYRSASILRGRILGIDSKTIPVKKSRRKIEEKTVYFLVVVYYRIKIIIPEEEVWHNENQPPHVLRSMIGAEIDFVITNIDREGECCVASRRMAMDIRRKTIKRMKIKKGKRLPVDVIAVGKNKLLASISGYDVTLTQKDLSYAMIPNLKDRYHNGNKLTAIIKEYDEKMEKLAISVKEAEPHPFFGADARHPIHSRRASVITGKYKGGVFCQLEENLDCLCTYSPNQYDEDFEIGDQVIVAITKFNYSNKQVYGKIVAKW